MADKIYRVHIDVGQEKSFIDVKRIIHAAGHDEFVEVWLIHCDDYTAHETAIQVIGTGMTIPEGWTYEVTGNRSPLGLVWHVISKRLDRA